MLTYLLILFGSKFALAVHDRHCCFLGLLLSLQSGRLSLVDSFGKKPIGRFQTFSELIFFDRALVVRSLKIERVLNTSPNICRWSCDESSLVFFPFWSPKFVLILQPVCLSGNSAYKLMIDLEFLFIEFGDQIRIFCFSNFHTQIRSNIILAIWLKRFESNLSKNESKKTNEHTVQGDQRKCRIDTVDLFQKRDLIRTTRTSWTWRWPRTIVKPL